MDNLDTAQHRPLMRYERAGMSAPSPAETVADHWGPLCHDRRTYRFALEQQQRDAHITHATG
jgi:hypothetical protein